MNRFKKRCDKVEQSINRIFLYYSNTLQETQNPECAKEQKIALQAVMGSAYFIAMSLLSVKDPKYKICKFIDENADPLHAFAYACYMQLDGLRARIRNKHKVAGILSIDFERILSGLSNHLGIKKEFFEELIQESEDMRLKFKIDPRDIWLEQDFGFYDIVTLKDFDIRSYMAQNKLILLKYSMFSQITRVHEADFFDNCVAELQENLDS